MHLPLKRYWLVAALVIIETGTVLADARYTRHLAGVPRIPVSATATEMAQISKTLDASATSYHLDIASTEDTERVFVDGRERSIATGPDKAIYLQGWAVDRSRSSPTTGVQVVIDGKTHIDGIVGASRPDVATALGSPAFANSGFNVTIPPRTLQRGTHFASLLILNAERTAFYHVKNALRIEVR